MAAEAARVDDLVRSGSRLPLAGRLLAVKDNIDVAGLPTTAACPAYLYMPPVTAPAVARLVRAGALVLGKTNMDQFATGLVGTRSPYGVVRNVQSPHLVAGGSSSGSAVAVALGIADIGLGTDTAGSGRVPAAFQGLAAVKPTRGLVPTAGVVPASRSFDCVTAFARTIGEAETAVAIMSRTGDGEPDGRPWPAGAPLGAPPSPVVAVPDADELAVLPSGWRTSFEAAVEVLAAGGVRIVCVDLGPFTEGSRKLYHSSIRAERYAAVGTFIDAHARDVDATVRAIISGSREIPAHQLALDLEHLAEIRSRAEAALEGCDVLLLPTATEHPSIADVVADPIAVNERLGRLTSFCNLFDMSAASVPLATADGLPFGVTVYAPAFADRVAIDVGRRLAGGAPAEQEVGPGGMRLLVPGAHSSGSPLSRELTRQGGRLVGTTTTVPGYRLIDAASDPPRPALAAVARDGQSVQGVLWELPPAAVAEVVVSLREPLSIGPAGLADGTTVIAFLCHAAAAASRPDAAGTGGRRRHSGEALQ